MVLSNTAVPIEYAKFRDSVIRGEVPVNKEVSMEMNRIDALIANPDFYYDDQAIKGFIDFCEEEMTLTDGGDLTLLPTFKLWAESALAWFWFPEIKTYNQERHRYEMLNVKRRLVNKQYLIVGRGAAKSVYAALMQAYFLVIDTETTQQIVTAPTMTLSEETMSPFRTAIARSKGPLFKFLTKGSVLSNTYSKVGLASTKKGIQNFMTGSWIEVRPMSIDKMQGARSKMNSVDEWLSGKVKEDVIGALEQGASKITDYFILATSSEGTARNGPGDTIKMELFDILSGTYYNPHVSIWHYKLDSIEEVGKPEMWLKANPNLGASVGYQAYQQDVERAESQPATRNDILAKRFGIPVEGYTYFFTHADTLVHGPQNFDGIACTLGIDLSQGDDFCAFTFLFPLGNGAFGVKTRSYVSALKVAKLAPAMKQKYQEFIKEGSLIVMDDNVLDMMKVFDDIDTFIQQHQYTIVSVGYDKYNAADFIAKWCTVYGEWGVDPVIQGARTESVPLGELQILANERLLLFDEELMKFAMGNAIAIEDNNGNRKLSKKRSSEKIDNVSALMDAWVVFKKNQEAFM
ncbi:MAG: terminase TerL endonuclease subunit [Anaerorhabdus sp.]|uniref:terminase TerL endonuclease subunit n=1 Tax=Anaerorhabdus sp. TaxID=1872524 RepID=UPI002FC65EA0